MKISRIIILLASLFAVLSFAVFADTITTPVRFIVPSTLSFTLSVPGNNASSFAVGSTTTTLIFNTTSGTATRLNATAAGSTQQQNGTIPIFNYTNTGNVLINITINFTAALPAGVTVKAGWNSTSWQSSCSASTIPNITNCINVTIANNATVANLSTSGQGSYREVWLWADYSSVTSGTDSTVNLVHTSFAG